jgi:hypothetical protein
MIIEAFGGRWKLQIQFKIFNEELVGFWQNNWLKSHNETKR